MKGKIVAVMCMTVTGDDGPLVLVTVGREGRANSKAYMGKQNTTRAAKLAARACQIQRLLLENGSGE